MEIDVHLIEIKLFQSIKNSIRFRHHYSFHLSNDNEKRHLCELRLICESQNHIGSRICWDNICVHHLQ
jgi:hypothetical protein